MVNDKQDENYYRVLISHRLLAVAGISRIIQCR